ncbi:polyketide synthase ligase [Streptomyces sp. NRRL F-4489]|uniref:class I adenylate-forming enzyme family protein n=1 Tax=Streptomyces sp. NRRL F-4489 TaxID=1609095 RepID=UPI0007466252|nr:fatty acid--CoA ligase family protein [Streptomyces sp. NRRL F-4489]KUL36310.1 polyketide synthase ligase [Streptomyces sp. NRRL F-4489]
MTGLTRSGVAGFLTRVEAAAPRADDRAPGGVDDVLADLSGLGLAPGEAVVLCLANGGELLRVLLAALLLGLVPLAVPPSTPWQRLRALAGHLGAGTVVTTRPTGDGPRTPVGGAFAVPTGHPPTPYRPGEILLSTSGTSGMFSACVHRVPALLHNARLHAGATGITASDTLLVNLPLYYSYALVAQALAAYATGARLVLDGPPFSPAGYRAAVTAHGVTHSSLTPTLARRLLAAPGLVPRGPRALAVGGDRLAPAEVAALLAARPSGELYLTYGLTEAGPRVSTLAAHAEPPHRHGSVGRPLPGVRASLRDVRDGVGELLVESDTVLLRRVGQRSGRVLLGPRTLATGDAFSIDDGYLTFHGRLSDFVVLRGEKVSLNTVRQAAHAIPGVVRCLPEVVTEDGGQVLDVHLWVTDALRGGERAVRRLLNSQLLPAERPRAVFLSPADPETFRK